MAALYRGWGFQQAAESTGPFPTDASELEQIEVPVLVLYGSQTNLLGWISESAHHVADHVATAQLREIDGLGHFAPVLGELAIADEIDGFFTARQESA